MPRQHDRDGRHLAYERRDLDALQRELEAYCEEPDGQRGLPPDNERALRWLCAILWNIVWRSSELISSVHQWGVLMLELEERLGLEEAARARLERKVFEQSEQLEKLRRRRIL